MGGITSDWRITQTTKARIVFDDGAETLEGGVLQARSDWTIYMPVETSVLPKDRVKVTNGAMRSRVFNITSVDYGRSDAILLIAKGDVVVDNGVDAL
jgi:head-tail adaptor